MAKKVREPRFVEALVVLALVIVTLLGGVSLQPGIDAIFVPLTLCVGIVAALGIYLGHSLVSLQRSMVAGIGGILIAGLIVVQVGMLVGAWVVAGTIPSLVFYGLKLLSPAFFLPTSFLVCVVMSLSIGTSLGTIATAGVVLLGIGTGLEIPAPWTVGAVISGAVFGDKMSPLSDSTNIAAAMGEADLFRHIRSMMYTTIPAAVVTLILYAIAGGRFAVTGGVDLEPMFAALEGGWRIHPIHLIPMLAMLALALARVQALLLLFCSVVFGSLWAMALQGASLQTTLVAATVGFRSETGVEAVDGVMSRGGIVSMQPLILLLFIAGALAGVMQQCGLLETLTRGVVSRVRRTGHLIVTTLAGSYAALLLTGVQPLALVLSGQVFRPIYRQRGIDRTVMTRSLEDSATLAAPLVPWTAAGAFVSQLLGVPTLDYLAYTWLPFVVPVFSVLCAYTGIGVWKETPESLPTA